MGFFKSSGSNPEPKPGTDWEAKKAAAGKSAKPDTRTKHDKTAKRTDGEILDLLTSDNPHKDKGKK